MGELLIFLVISYIVGLVLQFFLYKKNSNGDTKSIIYLLNVLYAMGLSYLAYTSLPSNYTLQKNITLIFGLLSVVSFIFKNRKIGRIAVNNMMITLSILGSIVYGYIM